MNELITHLTEDHRSSNKKESYGNASQCSTIFTSEMFAAEITTSTWMEVLNYLILHKNNFRTRNAMDEK